MEYRILIEKGEDSGFIAHCPAIPGCHSQGNTMEDAIDNIKDAIKGCLEVIDIDLITPVNFNQISMDIPVYG